jgi:hypothetical protein
MQAGIVLTMKIICFLVNIFSASLRPESTDLDAIITELSDQVGCLQKAHAESRGQIETFRRELKSNLRSIEQKIDDLSAILKSDHYDLDGILSDRLCDSGICNTCGQDHSFRPDFERVKTSTDNISGCFSKRLLTL